RVGEQGIVVAHRESAEAQKGMALGERVQVEQQFFWRVFGVAPTAMHGILLALFGAREIEVAAQPIGHREVGLQDAAQYFLVQLFLKGFGIAKDGVGVVVFGVEVSDDRGVVFVAKPGVVVDAAVAGETGLDGLASRAWRRRPAAVCGIGRNAGGGDVG